MKRSITPRRPRPKSHEDFSKAFKKNRHVSYIMAKRQK